MHCAVFPRRAGGEGANHVMKNTPKTHMLGLHIRDMDTGFQGENLPGDAQSSLRNQSLAGLSWCREH